MLQQTQVATVIPYYHKWLRRFPILPRWRALRKTTSSTRGKASAITLAREIFTPPQKPLRIDIADAFRRSVEQMRQLPGIGKYTAHAVASFAFNQSVPIVEANTARVLTRFSIFAESIDSPAGRTTLWEHAASLVPKSNARIYNSALIDLGALVCVPRKPKCGICPVKNFCRAKNPETLPVRKSRPRTTRLVENHAFVVRQGKILLEQSSKRWRGMWILPPLQTSVNPTVPIYTYPLSVYSSPRHT